MRATVRTEGPLSRADLSHVEERARLALEPFRPRVGRATLRVRAGVEALVELSVPLGTAGTVRIRGRGASVRSCAEEVIARAVDAITLRLRAERQELLEFLLLASDRDPGWAAPRRGDRRGPAKAKGGPSGRGPSPTRRGPKAAA